MLVLARLRLLASSCYQPSAAQVSIKRQVCVLVVDAVQCHFFYANSRFWYLIGSVCVALCDAGCNVAFIMEILN